MVHHLEEPNALSCPPHSVDDFSTPAASRVNEVNNWDSELGVGWLTGTCIIAGVNEDGWDFGDSSVDDPFDTSFGFVKSL